MICGYGSGMQTPWGHLKNIDLTDHNLCEAILSADKHQLVEGLVVENIFDQIVEGIPRVLPGAIALDVESVVVDTRRNPDRWHAFIWARRRQEGLGRYLSAMEERFRVWLLELAPDAGTFTAREWKDRAMTGERRALDALMTDLSGRFPKTVEVASTVRDSHRQKLGFWGYLVDNYRDDLGPRVILPRLLLNHGIQPWFRAVWNLDRILVEGSNVWMLEIKHKFPFGRRELRFGINDGELGVIRLLGETGIRCLHAILVKPTWSKDAGSAYLLGRLAERERAALIGVELDHRRVAAMFAGRQGVSSDDTTFTGSGSLNYRSLSARDFSRIGMITDQRASLAERLAQALTDSALPQVSDRWLRELKTP